MLCAGSRYRIAEVTHVFPQIQLRGTYTYTQKDERDHIVLLQLLRDFDNIADEHSIDYTICGGTLLGAIRHDGFIPWDSDADCDMPVEQAALLEQAYHQHPQYILKKTGYGYKIMRRKTMFPFIDIFLTEFAADQQTYQYVHGWTRSQYPNYRNAYNDIHPRRRYVFENLTLWGPSQGLLLCQRTYSSDCLQVAIVDSNGHITEEWRNNVVEFFRKIFQTPTTT